MSAEQQFDAAMDEFETRLRQMTAEAEAATPAWHGQERRDIGLIATDCAGILTGNSDLADSCAYEPPGEPERPALPGTEHLQGVEYEPLPKSAWLTENRSFAIAGAIAAVGIYMGWIS